MRIRGLEMLLFQKTLPTFLMDVEIQFQFIQAHLDLHRYTYSAKYRVISLLGSLILGFYLLDVNCYVIDFCWKKCKCV